MGNLDKIRKIFKVMQKATGEEAQASAVLVLSVVLRDFLDELDHVLCMGIRHGIFGKDANEDESLLDLNLERSLERYLEGEDEG